MKRTWKWFSFVSLFALATFFVSGGLSSLPTALGEEDKKELPPRKISIAPEYTGIIITEGEDVSLSFSVKNGGRQDEVIGLSLGAIPKGWKGRIKTYSFDVSGVHVGSDDSASLTLKLDPEKDVGPGDYEFLIAGKTADGELSDQKRITVTVKEKTGEEEVKDEGVEIISSYPVLEGPTDVKFEFSLEVKNETSEDTTFNLIAEGPENWEIRFKPAYEDKYFSSLRIKASQSESMAVEVKPYVLAEPGQYPIKIKVSSSEARGEAEFMVVLTGTYKLEAGTATGLLSLAALRGEEANLSIYVKNAGSATLSNIRFLSFQPENWKVAFEPETLETLAPGDLKQVAVKVNPAEQALVGDYAVALSIEGGREPKNLELRVTVGASAAWGWVGIGIIILVVAGLVFLFVRLGRR
jgi:uncharacterized membrane protein